MNIEEARLYLEHTSKEDFNLEEWQKENRYKAIQVILREIERLNNIINEKNKEIEDYSNKWCELAKAKTKSDNIINELEKDLYKIRDLTFTKYNSNEWNNCLSFNDDILPVINRLKELKGSDKNVK